jgi:hypothetical protein
MHETDVKVDLVREELEEKIKEMAERSRRKKFMASDALNTARDCKDMLEMMQRYHADRLERLEQGLSSTISAADAAKILEFKNVVQPMMMEMMGKIREGVTLIDQARMDAAAAHGELSAQVHALTAANVQLSAKVDVLSQAMEDVKSEIAEEKKRNKAWVDGLGAMVLSVQEHMLQLKPSSKSSSSSATATPLPALQNFEMRISDLEVERQRAAQELKDIQRMQNAAENVAKARIVELAERLTLVEDISPDVQSMTSCLKEMEKKLLEMHGALQQTAKVAENNRNAVKQHQDAMVAQASQQDAGLQQVLHKVQKMLAGLQQQTLQDREAVASAIRSLKPDVAAATQGLQQCKTVISTAHPHTPSLPQSQPVPVPHPAPHTSHTNTLSSVPPSQSAMASDFSSSPTAMQCMPSVSSVYAPLFIPTPTTSAMPLPMHPAELAHDPMSTAAPSHVHMALPAEFRLVRNVARSSGIGLMGPVVLGAPAPMSGVENVTSEAVIRQVTARVAPLGASAAPTVQMLPGTIAQALIGKDPGKFGGTAEEWSTWRVRWQGYLREVEELYPTMSNRQKLSLLRHWLDEATAELLDVEMQSQPGLLYEAYWARLDLSFGAEDKEVLRRTLRNTRLVNRGKLEEKNWRDFESKLFRLSRQLGDVTEVELGRLMIDALPPQPFRRKLAEEAEKKSQARRLVLSGVPDGMSAGQLEALITLETGRRATEVLRTKDAFKVRPADDEHRNTIKMVFDRQMLQSGAVLAVAPEVQELTAAEVSQLMLKWLRLEQRISPRGVQSAEMPPDQPRMRPRFQRKLDAEEEYDEEDFVQEAQVQEVKAPAEKGKAKQAPRRPATPPGPPPRPEWAEMEVKMAELQQLVAKQQEDLQELRHSGEGGAPGKGGWHASAQWQGRGTPQSWSGARGDAAWMGKGKGGRSDGKG